MTGVLVALVLLLVLAVVVLILMLKVSLIDGQQIRDELVGIRSAYGNLMRASRAVLPYLPERTTESMTMDGPGTQRMQARRDEVLKNEVVGHFTVLVTEKSAQTPEQSAKAYENYFGYKHEEAAAAAAAAPDGMFRPIGQIDPAPALSKLIGHVQGKDVQVGVERPKDVYIGGLPLRDAPDPGPGTATLTDGEGKKVGELYTPPEDSGV